MKMKRLIASAAAAVIAVISLFSHRFSDYEDGEYNWVIGNTSVYVSFDFEYEYYDNTVFFRQYIDL